VCHVRFKGQEVLGITNRLLPFDTTRTAEKTKTLKGGPQRHIVFPLPSNDKGENTDTPTEIRSHEPYEPKQLEGGDTPANGHTDGYTESKALS
jgi:hypothetical protein